MQIWNVESKFLGMLRVTFDESKTGFTQNQKLTTGAITNIQIFTKQKSTKTSTKEYLNFRAQLIAYENSDFSAFENLGVEVSGSKFKTNVLGKMRKIQVGSVLTYKDLAKLSGSPNAYRAVANICATNLVPLVIPCHRVVPSDYSVGQYAAHHIKNGFEVKTKLLMHENALA